MRVRPLDLRPGRHDGVYLPALRSVVGFRAMNGTPMLDALSVRDAAARAADRDFYDVERQRATHFVDVPEGFAVRECERVWYSLHGHQSSHGPDPVREMPVLVRQFLDEYRATYRGLLLEDAAVQLDGARAAYAATHPDRCEICGGSLSGHTTYWHPPTNRYTDV